MIAVSEVTEKARADALQHIRTVSCLLLKVAAELMQRAAEHDGSKLEEPELSLFAGMVAHRDVTYYSPEYKEELDKVADALVHHYAHNRHHPEHHEDGVAGMNLIDVIEMLCDWTAATRRQDDGSVMTSISVNEGRFGLDTPGLPRRWLENTVIDLEIA